MFGLDAVRTVHHSREHRSSCFVFHALHEEAGGLLKEDGMAGGVQLNYVAAFPANLKVYLVHYIRSAACGITSGRQNDNHVLLLLLLLLIH